MTNENKLLVDTSRELVQTNAVNEWVKHNNVRNM